MTSSPVCAKAGRVTMTVAPIRVRIKTGPRKGIPNEMGCTKEG